MLDRLRDLRLCSRYFVVGGIEDLEEMEKRCLSWAQLRLE